MDKIYRLFEKVGINRREKSYDRCFELWTTLGTSYNQLGQYSLAMKCFDEPKKIKEKGKTGEWKGSILAIILKL